MPKLIRRNDYPVLWSSKVRLNSFRIDGRDDKGEIKDKWNRMLTGVWVGGRSLGGFSRVADFVGKGAYDISPGPRQLIRPSLYLSTASPIYLSLIVLLQFEYPQRLGLFSDVIKTLFEEKIPTLFIKKIKISCARFSAVIWHSSSRIFKARPSRFCRQGISTLKVSILNGIFCKM